MQHILWQSNDHQSLEYFKLDIQESKAILEGTVVILLEALPAKINYRIECNEAWQTRAVTIYQERGGKNKALKLNVGEEQVWQTSSSPLDFATGLYDVDLEICPSTNFLPIRRLDLQEGQSQVVEAVWVRFPTLKLEKLHQIYTRLDAHLYNYEAPDLNFETQLEVNELGLVVNYRGLWQQIG